MEWENLKRDRRKGRCRGLLPHSTPTMTRQDGRKSFIFMQDNTPVHTAKKINYFLERNGYDELDDPAQSLDLNPLENIWWAIEKALLDKPLPPNKFQIRLREKSISSTRSRYYIYQKQGVQ